MSKYEAFDDATADEALLGTARSQQPRRAAQAAKALGILAVALMFWVLGGLVSLQDVVGGITTARQKSYNGLSPTPPRGWNSWNFYRCEIDEAKVLRAARGLVDSGLRDLGYQYVGIDDCWEDGGRDENGRLRANSTRFPRGIKALADDVHAMGLKLGIYSSAGTKTCQGYKASLDHEDIDAATFASWSVDLLKYDNCYNEGRHGVPQLSIKRYKAMSDALLKTGRSMVLSLCQWGQDESQNWAPSISNAFRITGDIWDRWSEDGPECPCTGNNCFHEGFQCSVLNILEKAALLDYARPSAWQDLDMLEVGNGGMTEAEYEAHFTLWSMLKLGNDLGAMSESTLRIVSNKKLLAINQDKLGLPARRVYKYETSAHGGLQWWLGPLSGGRFTIAVLNTDNSTQTASLPLERLFQSYKAPPKALALEDLWSGERRNVNGLLKVEVLPHSVKAYEARPR